MLDGTEIAALLISKRAHILRVGDLILIFNVVLFTIALATLGVNQALYSILTYVAAARTLDFVLYGIDEYTAITIVSSQHAAIRDRITRIQLGRGVTGYKGEGGFSGTRAADSLLRRHAPRNRQDQDARPRMRSGRLHRVARTLGSGGG